MKIPLVDLQALHRPIQRELSRAIAGVLETSDFVLGKEVGRFEEQFASYCGVRYGIGVDSGLSALELSLRALGIGPGDEVIVPTLSFIASASAVSFAGAEPIFVDVNPVTFCLDGQHLDAAITSRTKAVIPVHLYGLPAEMDAIMRVADEHGLKVIEDAAQAHGATYKGRRTGSLGHVAAFSFYPSKNLGAFGDGGMIVTNDVAVAKKARAMRNPAQDRDNPHEFPPFNRRLDSIHAAVLRVKLRYLDQWNEFRRKAAERYDSLLEKNGLIPPTTPSEREHVFHQYVVRSSKRNWLRDRLEKEGIEARIYYPRPIHRHPYYAYKGLGWGEFPIAEQACREVLSLPMHPTISIWQLSYVASKVNESSRNAKQVISANGSGYEVRHAVDDPAFELGKTIGN